MNRRQMMMGLMGLLTGAAFCPGKQKPHTDFLHGDVMGEFVPSDRSDSNTYSRVDCIPYLNGKPVHLVQRASAVEGWMDVTIDLTTGQTHRVYGAVQLLHATPKRRKEFADACGVR